jgi:hypothetical protein
VFSRWVFVEWIFVDPSWCHRQILICSGSFRSFETGSGCLRRVSGSSVVFTGDVWPLIVVFMVVSGFCGIFCQLLSCPTTFQSICGVLRRDLVSPTSFRQVSGELLETKVSVWLQVFCLVFQTVQFSIFLVKKEKEKGNV